MAGIPIELLYLLVLLIVIVIMFVVLKRPIYESMFIGFIIMAVLMGRTNNIVDYLIQPATNTLFYAIVAFLALAFIFGQTTVVNSIIDFILALVGRLRGGAGYVALFSSTFYGCSIWDWAWKCSCYRCLHYTGYD